MTNMQYDVSGGTVGRFFVRKLISKIWGVLARIWNAEHFTVFQKVFMQQAQHAIGAQEIWQRIGKHLDARLVGQHQIPVEEWLSRASSTSGPPAKTIWRITNR